MKKFTIFLFIFMIALGKISYTNPYTPNSQQWHNYNAAIWAEQDRIRAEREREVMIQQQNNQKTQEQKYQEAVKGYYKDNPFPVENVYSMILIDTSNGNVYWNLRFFEDSRLDDPAKIALYHMKEWFREYHNYKWEQMKKPEIKHFYFSLGETYSVARGQDKITKEWDLWIMPKGNKKLNKSELEKEALEFCNKEGYNCEIILTTTISKRIVK